MNQNVCPTLSEGVLAALPTRAARANKNGNHTANFNSLRTGSGTATVSDKV